MHTDVILVQAAVHPQALDRRLLHHNAYAATCAAIDAAGSASMTRYGLLRRSSSRRTGRSWRMCRCR